MKRLLPCLVSGFLGAVLALMFQYALNVPAWSEPGVLKGDVPRVVRAHRFELVNESGDVWGSWDYTLSHPRGPLVLFKMGPDGSRGGHGLWMHSVDYGYDALIWERGGGLPGQTKLTLCSNGETPSDRKP